MKFKEDGYEILRHGDCIGVDEQAHYIAVELGYKIIIHPPENPIKRAFCKDSITLAPLPYLDRNKQIVNNSDIIIAVPKENSQVLRSGTWSTVRFAQKQGKRIYIIYPVCS
jgi:hypothetical protein